MRCEWNPSTSLQALTTDEPHGEATHTVHSGKMLRRLCDSCAKLKRFKKHKPQKIMTTAEVLANFEHRVKQATQPAIKQQELCNAD